MKNKKIVIEKPNSEISECIKDCNFCGGLGCDKCCLDSNGNFVGWWEHGNFKTEGLDSGIKDK